MKKKIKVASCRIIRVAIRLDPKVYLISELPIRMEPLEFVVTAAVALLICLLATLYPSYRAFQLRPVAGLHGVRG